jgi:ribosomal protein L3 glutamine methyltransferase
MIVEQLINELAKKMKDAGVFFGHGSDSADDEAAELVFFNAGLQHDQAIECYQMTLDDVQVAKARELVAKRIETRKPAAYLTQRMWFAGHEFYVDERVLVPRSPIAELIHEQFQPWVDAAKIRRILDIGTGSGCIAIACALMFPDASVDAADVSMDALAVARINIDRHQLQSRVRAVQSDVFSGVSGRYDLIVSNPPYVSHAEMDELPPEYHHEPELGLRAGGDGLDIVRTILAQAEMYLEPHGLLLVEVGDSELALNEAFPRVPFMWLEFANGGGGVFVLTAAQLTEYREALTPTI